MTTLFSKPWFLAVLAAAFLAALVLIWTHHKDADAGGTLTKAQAAATEAQVASDLKQAGQKTTAAASASASASTSYEAGKAYADLGKVLNKQSKPHAKPTPSGDTAARRLQRQLTAY